MYVCVYMYTQTYTQYIYTVDVQCCAYFCLFLFICLNFTLPYLLSPSLSSSLSLSLSFSSSSPSLSPSLSFSLLPSFFLLLLSLSLSLSLSPSLSLSLSLSLSQSIQDDYDKLLTRDINVQFLQVLAPGVVHPSRSSNKTGSSTNVGPPAGTPSGDKSLADGVGINKRFKMEDLGLVWETVESLHHFLYPGKYLLERNYYLIILIFYYFLSFSPPKMVVSCMLQRESRPVFLLYLLISLVLVPMQWLSNSHVHSSLKRYSTIHVHVQYV